MCFSSWRMRTTDETQSWIQTEDNNYQLTEIHSVTTLYQKHSWGNIDGESADTKLGNECMQNSNTRHYKICMAAIKKSLMSNSGLRCWCRGILMGGGGKRKPRDTVRLALDTPSVAKTFFKEQRQSDTYNCNCHSWEISFTFRLF